MVIHVGQNDRTVNWPEMTPTSAFTLRQRLIDKNNAGDWLALGTMGWQMGLRDDGKFALATAARMGFEARSRGSMNFSQSPPPAPPSFKRACVHKAARP